MSSRVRSHAKINLGLAIGPVRADGYHSLATIYQTLAIHDFVEVAARRLPGGQPSRIEMTCKDTRVPCDERNTCWRIVERALGRLGITAEVAIRIDKRLPVQGGLGAGSANAAAALIGLERELGLELPGDVRLAIAAETGSDVPLFLVGGTMLGMGRGEEVYPLPDLPETACVVAVPEQGVSTPAAFAEWDRRAAGKELTADAGSDRLKRLGRIWASALAGSRKLYTHSSGVFPAATKKDRAGNLLLELVRAGIENDFEAVVFSQYPSLRDILEILQQNAVYAALSGSGSALFGLYGTTAESDAAVARLSAAEITALETKTLGRERYWREIME